MDVYSGVRRRRTAWITKSGASRFGCLSGFLAMWAPVQQSWIFMASPRHVGAPRCSCGAALEEECGLAFGIARALAAAHHEKPPIIGHEGAASDDEQSKTDRADGDGGAEPSLAPASAAIPSAARSGGSEKREVRHGGLDVAKYGHRRGGRPEVGPQGRPPEPPRPPRGRYGRRRQLVGLVPEPLRLVGDLSVKPWRTCRCSRTCSGTW